MNLVEREHVVRFRDVLLCLPTKRNARREYRDKTVPELLEMEIPEEVRFSASAVQQHLGRLATFFNWTKANRKTTGVADNPVENISLKVVKAKREPLTDEDLAKLFNSPDYRDGLIRTAYLWWLPLLGVFTGARISELVQLTPDDVREQDGIWLIYLPGTKSDAARRRVAVHSRLIELGFLHYVEAVRSRGYERLLHDLTTIGKRQPGKYASERVALLLDRCDIDSPSKVFHSTRHSANQSLVQGQPNLLLVQATIGHLQKGNTVGTTKEYFHPDRVRPALLKETIEAIRYEVDLSHLVDGWKSYLD